MALLLSRSPRVQKITVFAPTGSDLPSGIDPIKTELALVWTLDDPVSLLKALGRIIRSAPNLDAILFNLHVTSFGSRRFTNSLGLLLPVLTRSATNIPVAVYMHNFLETQDVQKLGYNPSRLTRTLIRVLETALIRSTRVIVPLPSQASTMRSLSGGGLDVLFLPRIEVVLNLANSLGPLKRQPRPNGQVRVLLFGHWGPQKDVDQAFRLLEHVVAQGWPVKVTVAGAVNSNFPEYDEKLRKWEAVLPRSHFEFRREIDERDVLSMLSENDLLFLPYRASGGYSGALNAASATGLRVLAYDVPQLRETAKILGVNVDFVDPTDFEKMARKCEGVIAEILNSPDSSSHKMGADLLQTSQQAIEWLIDLLSGSRSGHGSP